MRVRHLRWSIDNGRRHVKVLQQSLERTHAEVDSLYLELMANRSEYANWLAASAAACRRDIGGMEVEVMTAEGQQR